MHRFIALAALLALAGCVGAGPEDENVEGRTPCGQAYVSMQFAGTPEDGSLGSALDAAGYRLEPQGERVTALRPQGSEAVEGTLVRQPGASGDDLVVSVQERLDGDHEESVRVVARDLAQQVNQTYPNAHLTRWFEGTHTAGCGAPAL